jgi:hypothetical protein
MRFLIIENQRGELDSLILALKTSFSGAYVAPMPGTTTELWSTAESLLANEAQDNPEQVIFCDIALDSNNSTDARAGLEQVRQLFATRSQAIWIAYTSFTDVVDEAPGLFHAILSKQVLSRYRTPAERAPVVARVVGTARRKRFGDVPVAHAIEDSLGMRTFFAAFPDPVLEELIATECPGWSEVRVRALSAGYSGSSLLALWGHKGGATRHIVVKLAPRADLIERETHVLDDFFGEGADFAAKCARAHPVKSLSQHMGSYSLQEALPGPTLDEVLQSNTTDPQAIARRETALRTVIDVELAQCARGWHEPSGEAARKQKRLGLSSIDQHRAKKSCVELPQMAEVLAEAGGWPPNVPEPVALFLRIKRIIETWSDLLVTAAPLRWVLQHGDLNPRNVILGDAGQLTFIDLARLDHWPVGYDLCRLAIQLRIRLVDRARGLDWVQNGLARWCLEPVFALEGPANPATSLCSPAALCERRLHEWMIQQDNHEPMILGARMGALFDLVRIISYADLSPFKRLWASISFWHLADQLGWADQSVIP